ncbi:MAG: hypothetical protein G01um101472_623 [Parcubacteria group bacterium Gr01-1014_72]|nr:MAG: hypothetical protein G01um101472_623 [Parcubacteria group bacterium Gr01-1014_72]
MLKTTAVQNVAVKRVEIPSGVPFDPGIVPEEAWERITATVSTVRHGDIPDKGGNVSVNNPPLPANVHPVVFSACRAEGVDLRIV